MFNYFVSYFYNDGFGNCEIKNDVKISSYVDITNLQRLIEKKTNKPEKSIVILNFILLNERNDNQV